MGKLKKEHRKKVAARNAKIKDEQKKFQKLQHKFLMDLIAKEKEAGKFNNPVVSPDSVTNETTINLDSPTLTEQTGPII